VIPGHEAGAARRLARPRGAADPGFDRRGGRHLPGLARLGARAGLAGDEAFAARAPGLHRTLENKYWVDELYDRGVVRPLARLARICWKVFDELIIDGGERRGVRHRAGGRPRPLHHHRQRAPLRDLLLPRRPASLLVDGALMDDPASLAAARRHAHAPGLLPDGAALPLLFLRRASAPVVKAYALVVALVELGLMAMFAWCRTGTPPA
jgi:hypothetical protein